MRIIIEDTGIGGCQALHKCTIETSAECIDEVLENIIECLLGYGFQSESIKDAIIGKAEDYDLCKEKETD